MSYGFPLTNFEPQKVRLLSDSRSWTVSAETFSITPTSAQECFLPRYFAPSGDSSSLKRLGLMKKLLQVKFKHFLASSTLCAICALKEKDIKYLAISICFLTNICKNAEDNSNNSIEE